MSLSNRLSKVVKGGRRFKFSALVVVGDKAGKVGVALAKRRRSRDAIKRGGELARNHAGRLSERKRRSRTKFIAATAVRKLLRPASPGTGIIAGKTVRAVLEPPWREGYFLTKSLGSKNAATW